MTYELDYHEEQSMYQLTNSVYMHIYKYILGLNSLQQQICRFNFIVYIYCTSFNFLKDSSCQLHRTQELENKNVT